MPTVVEKALERLCVWVFFGVLFSLLPVIMDVMSNITRDGGATLEASIDHGELVLVTGALAALSLADLMNHLGDVGRLPIIALASVNFGLVAVCTGWYSTITTTVAHGRDLRGAFVADGSMLLLTVALLTGLCATVVVSIKESRCDS